MVTSTAILRHVPRGVLIGLLTLCCIRLDAEVFTLTDQQGRTITADVLSVEGNVAKIKRDDGREFDLTLSTLIEADQKKLKAWAELEAKKPKPLPPDAVGVLLSRAKFDSKKTESTELYTTTYTNGTTSQSTRTLVTTVEQWGYSLTVSNHTSKVITGLRAEYILFTGSAPRPVRGAKAAQPIDLIGARSQIVLKTGTVPITKLSYKGELGKPAGEKLYGIWFRLYKGDMLVLETSSPEILSQTETW